MKKYKVIRISFVEAPNKYEALKKVREEQARYFHGEFAVEVETQDWVGSIKRQVFGRR